MALQIKGKFVENAAIDGDKLELKVGQAIKQKKADGTTVEVIKVVEESGQVVVKANGQEIAFKSQVDGLSTQVATQTQALIAAETAARIADVNAEETRALAAESALSAAITAEEAARIAGDASTLSAAKDYVEQLLGVSDSASISALANLQTWLTDNDEATGVITALAAVEARVDTAESGISSLEGRMTTAEGDITAVESALAQELIDRQAGDATTLASANSYTDTEVGAEEAARIAGDAAEATARTAAISAEATLRAAGDSSLQAQITTLDSDLAAAEAALSAAITAEQTARIADVNAEETRALAAEAGLQGQLNTLGAVAHYKEKFVLSAADLAAGYIEFAREAKSNSIVASVGRLMIHQGEGEDFTVSVVAEKTRMTFVGNLVYPSPEELGEGDVIYVKYMA